MKAFRILVAVTLLVGAVTALAGETGSISGKVTDANGGPLPGVMVKVSGPQLPAGRTFLTGPTGAYNFQRLLPGSYTVDASLQGLGRASRTLTVQVDRDYQIELVLRGETAATVEVTAATVDQKSTEVASNFATEEIRQLPITRSYEGLLNLIPGAPSSSGSGYVAVAGGTRQDNKYLVDGVNITNPGYGYLAIETNELDIADVNIKTGAISAEGGRTSGAVVNAVTKSGTNELKGNLRLEGRPASFEAEPEHALQRDVDTYNVSAGVGFPLLKDVLFGYVSARYAKTTTSGQSATIGGVTTTQPDTKSTGGDYFGKLTAYIGESFLLAGGLRALPGETTDGFNSSYDAASAAWDSDGTNYVGNFSASWFAAKDTFVEAKYVHMTEDGTYGAANVLTDRPMTLDPLNLWKYGAYSDPARNGGNSGVYSIANGGEQYKRDEIKLTASQFLDFSGTEHQIKVGGGVEWDEFDMIRTSNGWGTLIYSGSNIRARYYNLQPKQTGRGRTYSAFFQDTVTWKRLSATVGVLANYDDFAQVCEVGVVCGKTVTETETRYNFMTLRWKEQIQPRIGVVYNAQLLDGDKAYANFGRYAGTDQKSTIRSFAPFRIREDQTYFSKATGAWIRDEIRGSSAGKYIPSDLEPAVQDEWVVGYAAPVGKYLSFDTSYQYKSLAHPFEDTPIDPNSYFGSFQAKNFPNASRIYRGFNLNVTKRYADSWYASLSYTYSKLVGNWDEDTATGQFNTSSYLEDEPGNNSDEPNRYGRLAQDRPHVLKLMASYDLYGFTVGGFFRYQSGRAWEARGYTPSGVANRYLEPAGSRRLPSLTTMDLLLSYNLKLGGATSVRLEGKVSNLFDTQTATSVNQLMYLDSYVDGNPKSEMGPQGTTKPNPLFGTETGWATPRRFTLSALLSF